MLLPLLRSICSFSLAGALALPAYAQYPPEQAFLGSPAMEEFEGRLRTHGLLARLQWAVVECKPGVMLVHQPDKGGEDFVTEVAVRYAGFVRQLGEILEESYFQDLPRTRGDFGYSLFIAENQRASSPTCGAPRSDPAGTRGPRSRTTTGAWSWPTTAA